MASASVSTAGVQRHRRPHLRTQPAEPDAARRCSENAEAPARPPAEPRPRAAGAGLARPIADLRLDSPTARTRISIGWRWRRAGLAEAEPVEGARIGALAEWTRLLEKRGGRGRGWGTERRWEVAVGVGGVGAGKNGRRARAQEKEKETMTRGNNLETRARTACRIPPGPELSEL